LGVIFAAVYILWMYQRVMLGPLREGGLYGGHTLKDINAREIASLIPIVVFIVWIGVYPSTFLTKSAVVAKEVVQKVELVGKGAQIRTAEAIQNTPQKENE